MGDSGLSVLSAAAASAPRHAGVYLFLDEQDDVLYVGKANSLPERLRQHASVSHTETHRLNQKYDLVHRVAWEVADDEKSAFWRESELIFALRPPFNTDVDVRARNLAGKERRAPYIVVADSDAGQVRFALERETPSAGRAYGCFPHLGKGMGSHIGIACSDGYTAFLRLVWAASGNGAHMPSSITRSAPASFTVPVAPNRRDGLHRFLSGTRARLVDELLRAGLCRPDFMQPALRRDKEAALQFFAAGPRLVRTRRLRHGIRSRVLDEQTYRNLVRDEISPAIDEPNR